MKTTILKVFVISLMLLSTSSFCQVALDSSGYDETLWNMKKRRLVIDHMDLSEAEKASFWPVYESYCRAIEFLESENIQIIIACNDKSSGLDQKDVESYSKTLLQNELLLDRVRIQYFKKFSKALSPARASQFMQLDDNLRMALRFNVQEVVHSANETQASIR